MTKLYRRNSDGRLEYHEAWADGNSIIEHWGVAGTQGETKTHRSNWFKKSSVLNNVLQSARQQGFAEISPEEHATLIVEYRVEGMGTASDLDKRHELEQKLNQVLGWTGLGLCDGGSVGAGSMEVCCFVVDFALAKQVIEADLSATAFSDYSRIYNENEDSV